jgi:hypothetical protein
MVDDGQDRFELFSQDREWVAATAGTDRSTWSWLGTGAYSLSGTKPIMTAPAVDGQHPWDGKGITAAIWMGRKQLLFSADKMWVGEYIDFNYTFTSSGALPELDGWKDAPAVGCGP